MLKGTEPVYTTKPSPQYKRSEYVLSPSSEYYIHGRGSESDYKAEVGLVKAQLRERAFGQVYEEEPKKVKKPINASGIVLLVFMAAVLIASLIGKATAAGGWLLFAEGTDGISAIQGFIGEINGGLAFGINLATTINYVVMIVGIIGCLIGVRKQSGGTLTLIWSIVWLIANVLTVAAAAEATLAAEKLLIISTIFSFVSLITASAEKAKRRKRALREAKTEKDQKGGK